MSDPAMRGAPLTTTLAEWAASVRYEALPAEVVHHARRVVLDYAAAIAVGSTSGPARTVREHLAETEVPWSLDAPRRLFAELGAPA